MTIFQPCDYGSWVCLRPFILKLMLGLSALLLELSWCSQFLSLRPWIASPRVR